MFEFAKNKLSPIALDIGHNSIKMLQFMRKGEGTSVYAADKMQCSCEMSENSEEYREWTVQAIREMFKRGGFSDTGVISCIPNDKIRIKSLRIEPSEADELDELINDKFGERFHIDPKKNEIRYIPAGKVYHGSEIKQEVIFFIASHKNIEDHIKIIEEAGLAPEAIDPVPCAILRSHLRSLRRQVEQETIRSFIDIGSRYTTVVVGNCNQVYFIKIIPTGGMNINEEAANKLGISIEEAMMLRIKIQQGNDDKTNKTARQNILDTTVHCVDKLAREIAMCFRYCAVTFRGHHPEEVILTGGESYEQYLIEALQKHLNVNIEIAEPLRGIDISNTDFGLDQDTLLPEWAVATGLGFKKWHVNNLVNAGSNERY